MKDIERISFLLLIKERESEYLTKNKKKRMIDDR
jgi:hypothetical protein